MPFRTTVNWLFNDIWRYLIIGCFIWKIGVFSINSCRGLLYPQKAFPINLHFLDTVGVCPKHLFFTSKKHFSRRKGLEQVTDKVHKKGHEKFFRFTDANVYKKSISLFHFFIWLSVKCKDFLMSSNLYQIVHVFSFTKLFTFLVYSIRTN